MVALPSEGPKLDVRVTCNGVDGISTAGSAMAMSLGGSETWACVGSITASVSAVDSETSTAPYGSGVGVEFPSSEEILEKLLERS